MKKTKNDQFSLLQHAMEKAFGFTLEEFEIQRRHSQQRFRDVVLTTVTSYKKRTSLCSTEREINKHAFNCLQECISHDERFRGYTDVINTYDLNRFRGVLNFGIEGLQDETLFLRLHVLATKAGVPSDRLVEEVRDFEILQVFDFSWIYVIRSGGLLESLRSAAGERKVLLQEALNCFIQRRPFPTEYYVPDYNISENQDAAFAYYYVMSKQVAGEKNALTELYGDYAELITFLNDHAIEESIFQEIEPSLHTLVADCIAYQQERGLSERKDDINGEYMTKVANLISLIKEAKTFSLHLLDPEAYYQDEMLSEETHLTDFMGSALGTQIALQARLSVLKTELEALLPQDTHYLVKKIAYSALMILGLLTMGLAVTALITMPPMMLSFIAAMSTSAASHMAAASVAAKSYVGLAGALCVLVSVVGLFKNSDQSPNPRSAVDRTIDYCCSQIASIEGLARKTTERVTL